MCVYEHSISSSTMQGGFTSLYLASQEGHTEILDILLTKGADPNLTTKVCMSIMDSLSLTCVMCASALSYL